MSVRIAIARYRVERVASFEDFAAKQARIVEQSRAAGAQLLVLPEYLGMELATAIADHATLEPAALALAVAPLAARFDALFQTLADRARIEIVAGSFLCRGAGELLRNRSTWFAPQRMPVAQDKLALTGFERALGCLEPGDALTVVEFAGTRAGIAICYDIEFPLPPRAQVEAGARLIVCPSCSDTDAGAMRMQIGAAARALENQIFVAKAVTAGDAPFNAFLDTNTGEAALHTPVDLGFAADGLLAVRRVAIGEAGALAIAELDFSALATARRHGAVRNHADWPQQLRPSLIRARLRGTGPRS